MKKFLVLLVIAVLFVACDYAEDATKIKPDIEITWINPVAWYTFDGDTTATALIAEIHFVPENSVDCYIEKLVWEYYDENDNLFFGPDEMALYLKIDGKVEPTCCDTFILYGVQLPLAPVRNHLSNGQSARALLHFIAVEEYYGSRYDTATVWFGIHMMPLLSN